MRSGVHVVNEAFSERVQKHLRNGGYSQKQLADAVGLHPKVLSRKLAGSRNAFLSHAEVTRIIKALADWRAIVTQDEALHLLAAAEIEPGVIPAEAWQSPPLNLLARHSALINVNGANLPYALPAPTTRLIGREWAVERLRRLLARQEVRLVTLFGPGGSGKSRLALHMAGELSPAFAQGAWFVTLAGVSDAELVPLSILQALHVGSTPDASPLLSLVSYLRNKQALLVLDNFEHVAAATSVVGELLAAAPGLKLLVTSRAVLHVYGEHEFSVPPLDIPNADILNKAADLLQYTAVQLFVERAQALVPDFELTVENAGIIAQICARLDGLPLALELAAARVKVLSPQGLLERLSQARLPLLTGGARNLPGRLQTMRDTITWSYDLLSPVEQVWFCRLGVFSSGWSLEAAEAMILEVAAGEGEAAAVDILAQLVDNSLVVRLPSAGGQARFTMLETLREYALERLAGQGERERLRDWHAWYFLREAEAGEIGLRGPQQREWLAKLTADRDNFRAALEWGLQRAREGSCIRTFAFHRQQSRAECRIVAGSRTLSTSSYPGAEVPAIELCLRLAAALRHSWEWQGDLAEARRWLGAALDVPISAEAGETLLAARAKALSEASRLACLQNDQVRAVALAEESIALGRRLHDPMRIASTMLHLGWAFHAKGEYEAAKDAYSEGLERLTSSDDAWMRAQLLFHLAAAVGFTRDFEEMRSLYAQGRALFEQLGDRSSIADPLKDQGGLALLEGDYITAIDYLLQSLKLCYQLNHRQHLTTGVCLLAIGIGMNGKPDPIQASLHSAQLEGVGDSLEEAIGLTSWTKTDPLVQMVRLHIRSQVEEQSWEAAYAAGRALSLPQAIDLAGRLGEDLRAG